jgi:hypothetical protein
VRSALGWFVGMFLFGGIAGWSVPQWSVNRAVALWGLTIPLVAAVLIGVGYYYTNGTMAAREYPTDPSSPGRHPSSP